MCRAFFFHGFGFDEELSRARCLLAKSEVWINRDRARTFAISAGFVDLHILHQRAAHSLRVSEKGIFSNPIDRSILPLARVAIALDPLRHTPRSEHYRRRAAHNVGPVKSPRSKGVQVQGAPI